MAADDSGTAGTGLFDLTGRVAAVIGGTGALGGAVCRGFGDAGAAVAVLGRSRERADELVATLEAKGIRAAAFVLDASDRASVEAAQKEVEAKLGPVDVLVNAVGINSSTPFFELGLEEWHRVLDTNLTSALLACQIFGRAMVDRGQGGSIINLGSMSGVVPLSRVFTYSASKAAVHNISKNLAREWAAKGVRVNILVPGFFPAEQNRKILSPDRVASIMAKTPMARFGEAHELIGAALLLASDAGSFITGTELVVDGGFDAMTI